MKTVYILAFIGLVIVVVGYFYTSKNNPPIPEPDVTAQMAFNEPATLTPLATDVSVANTADTDWSVVEGETEIVSGSLISTSPTGRALITSGAEILTTLDANTSITFLKPDDVKGDRFFVESGRTWSRVERALEQDEVYEVFTPTMVAAVRGTSFGTEVGKREAILVAKGTVGVAKFDPLTKKPIPETEKSVTAGNKVAVKNGELVIEPIVESDKDTWFLDNNPEEKVVEPKKEPATKPTNNPPIVTPPAPVTEPPAEPPAPTSTAPNPMINSVSPEVFDYRAGGILRVRGTGFTNIIDTFIDNRLIEYTLMSDTLITIDIAEVPQDFDRYSITLTTLYDAFVFPDAFEVKEDPTASPLHVEEVVGITDPETSEPAVIIRGHGMNMVTNVNVDGQSVEYQILSDAEIMLRNFSVTSIREVVVSGNGHTATGYPN